MTNHYILNVTSKGADASFKISYRSGKFHKLEAVRQRMSDEQRNKLMTLVPIHEKWLTEMEAIGGVEIEKIVKDKSIYTQYNELYFEFYERLNSIKPRFNAAEGKALKSIIKHLTDLSTNEQEALATWDAILKNWHQLEDFYSKQMELRQINSNINIILRQLKNGTGKSGQQSKTHADGIRKSL